MADFADGTVQNIVEELATVTITDNCVEAEDVESGDDDDNVDDVGDDSSPNPDKKKKKKKKGKKKKKSGSSAACNNSDIGGGVPSVGSTGKIKSLHN